MFFDRPRLNTLQKILSENIEDFCQSLSLKVKKYGDGLIGPCEVHGGDGNSSLRIFTQGDVISGWVCWSKHCENKFTRTLIGLARGVISNKKYDWPNSDKIATLDEAIDFCCNFLGIKFLDIKPEEYNEDKHNFVQSINTAHKIKINGKYICNKSYLMENLKVPANYFINRGYLPEILKEYCVGYCDNNKKEMYNRVVCPIFDDDGKNVVSAVARSIYEDCPKCKEYHNPDQPCLAYPKWKHLKNTKPNSYLYNYWNAKDYIIKTGKVILVEGVGDVLKLIQCGVRNVLGIFGNDLSDCQKIILERSPIYNLFLLLDNDSGGRTGMEKINNELKYLYRIKQVNWEGISQKDVGGMADEQINSHIISQF